MNNDGKIQRFNGKWKFDVYAVDGHRSVQLLQLNRESQRTREKKSIEAMLAVCVCDCWHRGRIFTMHNTFGLPNRFCICESMCVGCLSGATEI